jgi:hypothetical protein
VVLNIPFRAVLEPPASWECQSLLNKGRALQVLLALGVLYSLNCRDDGDGAR